ncbi:glycosyltransferase, partial [Phascolarctobacterium faecium]|uniref:glycosyltransferase n=1 Tax=Phascolarctobacterium faecium TaxID=33025 RepID=UPI00210ABB67
MHNEEKVAHGVLDALLESNSPVEKFEVIPINDLSEDGTKEILEDYAVSYGIIHPLHRNCGERGKP